MKQSKLLIDKFDTEEATVPTITNLVKIIFTGLSIKLVSFSVVYDKELFIKKIKNRYLKIGNNYIE